MTKSRAIVQVLCFVLPWVLRRLILRTVLRFDVDRTARIGFSVILADKVELAAHSKLGHFTYVGTLDSLQLGEKSYIGNFNWITGLASRFKFPHYGDFPNRRSALTMGSNSMIGHRHLLDCTDTIELGEFSLLAGYRSQLLTHGIEPVACRQTCAPIKIGAFTMVGAGCLILKDVDVPKCCVVSAGAVIRKIEAEPYSLLAGNPAVVVRKFDESARLFSRTEAVIL
jgi:carbonic anhydrase/acetyltransferase-like protein (isoleucine patch superfamily)